MVPPFVADMLMRAEYLAKLVATAKEEELRKEIKARSPQDGDSQTTKGRKQPRILDERDGDDGKQPKGSDVGKEDNNPQIKDATPPLPPSPASNPPQKDRIDPLRPDASPFTNSTMTSQASTTYVTVWKTVLPVPSSSSTPVTTVYVPIYITASSSIEPTTSTSALAATSQSTVAQVPTSVTSVSPTSTTSISRTSFQRYTGTSRASLLTTSSTSVSSSETVTTSLASEMAASSSSITSAISSPQASSSSASTSQASSSQVLTSQPSTTQSSTSQASSSQADSSSIGSRTTFQRFQASCTSASTSCTISSTISSSISGGASITATAAADTASSTSTATAASQSLDKGIGTTLVVFAGLGGAALVFFGIWACIKRRIHGINELKDPKDGNEKDMDAFSGAGRRKSDNESRLWGPAATGAGTETTQRSHVPLAMPTYVPPTMPRSPAYDLYQARQQEAQQMGSETRSDNNNNTYNRTPELPIQTQEIYYAPSPGLYSPQYPQNLQPVSPSMAIVGAHDPYRRPHPSPRAYGGGGGGAGGGVGGDYGPVELPGEGVNPTSQYSEYTDIQPQSQWSVSRDSSTTISTVPRFRNIESWASDQRLRSEGEGGSGVGQGGKGSGLGGPLGDGVPGGRGVGVGPAGSGLRNVI